MINPTCFLSLSNRSAASFVHELPGCVLHASPSDRSVVFHGCRYGLRYERLRYVYRGTCSAAVGRVSDADWHCSSCSNRHQAAAAAAAVHCIYIAHLSERRHWTTDAGISSSAVRSSSLLCELTRGGRIRTPQAPVHPSESGWAITVMASLESAFEIWVLNGGVGRWLCGIERGYQRPSSDWTHVAVDSLRT